MRVHLMGVGGAGVSALARVFLARGDEVSGCDTKESETTEELEDAGVRIMIGHDPEHVLFQDLLVYSGAIKGSPELDAARAMGLRVLSRAEMLAQLINESDSIAIAGTAGKTTTTHMLGHILVVAGYDPTVLVGDGASSRAGRSSWLVAETDESDGTLTLHHPRRTIVTNIELDHPDHFRDVTAVRDLFQCSSRTCRRTALRSSAPTTSWYETSSPKRGASPTASGTMLHIAASTPARSRCTTTATSSAAST